MSKSTLYSITHDLNLRFEEEFGNSWIFSPMIWEILCQKYVPREQLVLYEEHKIVKRMWSGDHYDELFGYVNPEMNKGIEKAEQICWELSQQQVFMTKDKDRVADGIEQFIFDNAEFSRVFEENEYSLRAHIYKRFIEVAKAIRALDPEKSKFFIHKNTSVDDSIEYLFTRYPEQDEEAVYMNLEEGLAHYDKKWEFVVFDADGNVSFKYWDEMKHV